MARYWINESLITPNGYSPCGFTLDTESKTVEIPSDIHGDESIETYQISEVKYNDNNQYPVSIEDGELIGTPE